MKTSGRVAGLTRKRCSTIVLAFGSGLLASHLATTVHAAGVLELKGKGVQIYRCTEANNRLAWTLVAPDATLTSAGGQPAGHHFAGPTWQAQDGSAVVGEPVAAGSIDNAEEKAVPWLVLRVKSTSGKGVFEAVTFVTRTHTVGGMAPAAGCDISHTGNEIRIAYSAIYTFFGAK